MKLNKNFKIIITHKTLIPVFLDIERYNTVKELSKAGYSYSSINNAIKNLLELRLIKRKKEDREYNLIYTVKGMDFYMYLPDLNKLFSY